MSCLGYTSTVLRAVRQRVPLDERDRLVKVREHSSSEQSGHTRTADDGSLSGASHRHSPHKNPMTVAVDPKNGVNTPVSRALTGSCQIRAQNSGVIPIPAVTIADEMADLVRTPPLSGPGS